jgi:hypothetical protein
MPLRLETSEICDDARSLLQDLGMRYRVVVMESDANPNPGLQSLITPPAPTQVRIAPNPRIRSAPRYNGDPSGIIQSTDITMDRISRLEVQRPDLHAVIRVDPTYDEDTMRWVGGTTYRVVAVEEQTTQWSVVLRPIHRGDPR